MSIAKAKANAIAITHRSVVGREPQTAILYSTPLCPPLILNCERFFSTKKITRDRDEHFSELQWFWSSESELDCRYLPQTVIPYSRPPQQREASLLTEKLFSIEEMKHLSETTKHYNQHLFEILSFFLLKAVFVVPFIDISHLTWCDFQKMSTQPILSKYLSYRDEAKQISR